MINDFIADHMPLLYFTGSIVFVILLIVIRQFYRTRVRFWGAETGIVDPAQRVQTRVQRATHDIEECWLTGSIASQMGEPVISEEGAANTAFEKIQNHLLKSLKRSLKTVNWAIDAEHHMQVSPAIIQGHQGIRIRLRQNQGCCANCRTNIQKRGGWFCGLQSQTAPPNQTQTHSTNRSESQSTNQSARSGEQPSQSQTQNKSSGDEQRTARLNNEGEVEL